MHQDDPDVRLMLAYRSGDDAALATLYRRWAGPLLRFLTRMMGDVAMAEEIVQESFLRVHGARKRYAPDARFSTWLFRIGRNLALNELDRSRNKAIHLSAETSENREEGENGPRSARPGLMLVSSAPDAETIVDTQRLQSQVEAALSALPERQRAALWLAAVEGCAYAEIAEVLDTTPSSVKALVHRARTQLADRMLRNKNTGAASNLADAKSRGEQSGKGSGR